MGRARVGRLSDCRSQGRVKEGKKWCAISLHSERGNTSLGHLKASSGISGIQSKLVMEFQVAYFNQIKAKQKPTTTPNKQKTPRPFVLNLTLSPKFI